MLREIVIKNFAIIDALRISFSGGMTILSGETGAGKSIIIAALNTLLGSRADAGMIRTGEESAELEALFEIDPEGAAGQALQEQGYDPTEELLIRRIISAGNRHRIYINGRMATMQVLGAVTENLAGISGQHEHQRLLRESEHLRILDQFGGLTDQRRAVHRVYHEIMPKMNALDALHAARADEVQRIELLQFQNKEIADAAVAPGEDESLKQELNRLKHSQVLYQSAGQGVDALYDREGAIADQLNTVQKMIEKAAGIDPALTDAAQALAEASFRVEDTARQLRSYLDTVAFDPERVEVIESRLDILNRLKRKYGGTLEAVSERFREIEMELAEAESLDGRIAETEVELEGLRDNLVRLAGELSEKRRSAAGRLAGAIEAELASLNMPETRFSVEFRTTAARPETPPYILAGEMVVSEHGIEQAAFMIAPNVGETLRPLSKIASGGELSRVILALKAILADTEPVETIVFDEVDAGIGGETAEVVGRKLAGLAGRNQVICITHLVQIARFGDHHFKIEKHVDGGRTATRIIRLEPEDRVEETARMIGGRSITDTTRAHAAELLKSGRKA